MNEKNIKRISITLILVLLMQLVISIIGNIGIINVVNAEELSDNNYKYKILEDGTIEISKYIGNDTEVIIPRTINEKEITTIGNFAFYNCDSITSIEIPDSVTKTNIFSFDKCSSLTSIDVSEDNKNYASIDGVLFNKEKTTIIKYPDGKKDEKYTIPNSVISMWSNTFQNCSNLTEVEISENITNLSFFEQCSNLTNINVSKDNKRYSSEDGVVFNKQKTIIVKYPEGKKDENYTIPSTVMEIDSIAFQNCNNLINIEIPNSVKKINMFAFKNCKNLTKVEIPSSVTDLGISVFFGCNSLVDVKIQNGVTVIPFDTFGDCSSLKSIEIPSSVTTIEISAFSNCTSLVNVQIPDSVVSINNEAFRGCRIMNDFKISNNLTSINENVFYECKLIISSEEKEIELPDIIKRAKKEGDILYTDEDFTLENCTIKENKLIINDNLSKASEVSLKVNGGKLDGLELIVQLEFIEYSTKELTKENVTVTLNLNEGDIVKNNDGKNTYVFEKNGEFTFEYLTKEGIEKKAIAKVTNIYTLGDINDDEKIDITDLLLLKRHMIATNNENWKLTEAKFKSGDINEDENINITDLLLLKRIILKTK